MAVIGKPTIKKGRATMQDVARQAGVSMATVSHVINETRYVSPDTVEQVRAAIRATAYTPNSLARSLVTNSTSTVGLVVSWNANPYFSDIISAIETECSNAGISVLLADSNDNPDKELRVIEDLHERRVDGIFLAAAPDSENRSIDYIREKNVTAVLIDRQAATDLDFVGIQNTLGMDLLIDHLVGHGYEKIGFIPGNPGYQTTIERTQRFTERMAHHHLPTQGLIAGPSNSTIEADFSVLRLLDEVPDVQAVITGNNLATIGAMRALRSRQLRIPTDIALVGVDDFEWADSFEPRLTVIAQPCKLIGSKAVQMMIERLKDPSLGSRITKLTPKLIVRDSCGCGLSKTDKV